MRAFLSPSPMRLPMRLVEGRLGRRWSPLRLPVNRSWPEQTGAGPPSLPGAGAGYDPAVGAIEADRSAPICARLQVYRAAILCQVEFETSDVWTLGVPSATFATAFSTSG